MIEKTRVSRETDESRRIYRVAFVNSHPIQYFAPLYRQLSSDPDLDVTVFYCSDATVRGTLDPGFGRTVAWDIDILSGYPHRFVGNRAHRRPPSGFFSLMCPGLWTEIRGTAFDALVVHGYAYGAYVIAMLAAKSSGIPVLVRSETHLRLRRPRWRRVLRDGILRRVYRALDGFLAIGTSNADYYRSLGVPQEKIHLMPYTVDNRRFEAQSRISEEERSELRRRYDLPEEDPLVLFVSKLSPRKRPDVLLEAVSRLQSAGVRVSLLLVGTGEIEGDLRLQARRTGVANVAFAGFVNQRDLPRFYGSADVFVLPSEDEPWGLVVNEAMCAGLPVVVSEEVGCAPDLVKPGDNGTLVNAGAPESLATALRPLLIDRDVRRGMGQISRRRIASWSYSESRKGLIAALERVTSTAEAADSRS